MSTSATTDWNTLVVFLFKEFKKKIYLLLHKTIFITQ